MIAIYKWNALNIFDKEEWLRYFTNLIINYYKKLSSQRMKYDLNFELC